MLENNKTLILIDKAENPSKLSIQPDMEYISAKIANVFSSSEKERISFIEELIYKRKTIRNSTIDKLDDLIVYCDNKILSIGDDHAIRTDPVKQQMASAWQKSIVDLEKQKAIEAKEHFRDTLFLRNELIKSKLLYKDGQNLESILSQMEKRS